MSIATTATAFSELQALVLTDFIRTDKTVEIKRALNDTYKEMVACVDPRRQRDQIYKATVAGREEYPIPTGVLRLNHPIRLIDPAASSGSASSYPLHFLTKVEYDEIETNPNASTVDRGKPWAYTVYKNSVLLTDIPDQIYNIEMNVGGEATPMVEEGDATIFAPTWDETIKAGALSRLYANLKDWDTAGQWQTIYRWGFAGREGLINGGLELLKRLEQQATRAQLIVNPRDF